jgi:hypothetical protein
VREDSFDLSMFHGYIRHKWWFSPSVNL